MIFVDTNVIMYAVGRRHPLRAECRAFFESTLNDPTLDVCTSAEVLQELLHAYIPVRRMQTLDAALSLVASCVPVVLAVEAGDVRAARALADRYPELGARDLLHLSVCRRHDVTEIKTYDRALGAAFSRKRP